MMEQSSSQYRLDKRYFGLHPSGSQIINIRTSKVYHLQSMIMLYKYLPEYQGIITYLLDIYKETFQNFKQKKVHIENKLNFQVDVTQELQKLEKLNIPQKLGFQTGINTSSYLELENSCMRKASSNANEIDYFLELRNIQQRVNKIQKKINSSLINDASKDKLIPKQDEKRNIHASKSKDKIKKYLANENKNEIKQCKTKIAIKYKINDNKKKQKRQKNIIKRTDKNKSKNKSFSKDKIKKKTCKDLDNRKDEKDKNIKKPKEV